MEFIGSRNTRLTVNVVPTDITDERLGYYFSKFEQVSNVTPVISKMSIAIGYFIIQMTISRKRFLSILDTLTCRDHKILITVRPHCWSCSATGRLINVCLGKKPASQLQPKSPTEAVRTDRTMRKTFSPREKGPLGAFIQVYFRRKKSIRISRKFRVTYPYLGANRMFGISWLPPSTSSPESGWLSLSHPNSIKFCSSLPYTGK